MRHRPLEDFAAADAAQRRWAWILIGFVALGVVIRVVYALLEAPELPPVPDDQFYFRKLAALIADGHGFASPYYVQFRGGRFVPTAERPPLYPLLLAGPVKLGANSVEAQRLVGSLFGAGTIAALALLTRRYAGARAGLIAAGLAAVYPLLIAADGALMSESLFALLVALSLLVGSALLETPSVRRAALLGAIVALAALTRGEGLLFLPLLVLPLLRQHRGVRLVLAATAAAAVVLAPWVIRNWTELNRPLLASSYGEVLAGANCHKTYYGDQLGGWWAFCKRPHHGDEVAQASALQRDGLSYAREHVGRLPVVLAARLARISYIWKPVAIPPAWSPRVRTAGMVMFFALFPLAIAGCVVLRRRRRRLWVLLTPFAVVALTAMATYGNERFRQPVELSVVVLAAVALDAVFRQPRHLPSVLGGVRADRTGKAGPN